MTWSAETVDVRPDAARRMVELVAPGGTLLVITRGREPEEPAEALPWPLVRAELDAFTQAGLELERFDDVPSLKHSSGRRFRAEYRAPAP